MKLITLEGTYQARIGWPARIHATDLGCTFYPVLATILDPDKEWITVHLTANGNFITTGEPHYFDLIEVKPQITITFWANVYKDAGKPGKYRGFLHSDEIEARQTRSDECIMTIPVTITGQEGNGL